MPEIYAICEFECPECNHTDEDVYVPEPKYIKALETGKLEHTCSECGCVFEQAE